MNTRRNQLLNDIADMKKEVEVYENCLNYATKYSVLGDIEYYGELRNHIIRRIERAEDELQQLKSA
ncbi:hypothetical protein D3C81_174320 [compost metagenome]